MYIRRLYCRKIDNVRLVFSRAAVKRGRLMIFLISNSQVVESETVCHCGVVLQAYLQRKK